MKKLAFFFFLLLPVLSLAQRTDLDKTWFDFTYRRLPNKVLDNSFMTYSVSVEKTVALDMYSNENATARINIEGRKKVDGNGHFQVRISLGDLIIESSQVKERVEVHKDKDGKETGRSYYYWAEVIYSFAASAEVFDFHGQAIGGYSLAERQTRKTYNTAEYSKSSDAANFYNNNKLEIKTQLVRENIDAALSSLNSGLNSDFGYSTIKTREYLWGLGTKKSPEYAAYGQACETMKAALQSVSNDAVPAEIIDRLQPAVDYFIQLAAKYNDPGEKDHKKIRYGAYYNIMTAYFLAERFEEATEYANKLIANEYDKKDGENLIKDISKLKELFNRHGINTRHFHPDVENAIPPQM